MGEVYRARDTRLEREVAIKMLPASLANDAPVLERFHREALAVASLNHPHICTLYDVGDDKGRPYLLMELLDGGTLQERCRSRRCRSSRRSNGARSSPTPSTRRTPAGSSIAI
jgi:serine/threonine protein kinase